MLESVYEQCLAHELAFRNVMVERQISVPVIYRDAWIDAGFRMDMVVGRKAVVEITTAEKLIPLHEAQLLTYLKLPNFRLGLLINFNVTLIKDGIRRLVRS